MHPTRRKSSRQLAGPLGCCSEWPTYGLTGGWNISSSPEVVPVPSSPSGRPADGSRMWLEAADFLPFFFFFFFLLPPSQFYRVQVLENKTPELDQGPVLVASVGLEAGTKARPHAGPSAGLLRHLKHGPHISGGGGAAQTLKCRVGDRTERGSCSSFRRAPAPRIS